MQERDTTQVLQKATTDKINFLEQTIPDVFRWQEACVLADEHHSTATRSLRTRLTDLLYFALSRIRGKRRQVHP